MKQRLLMVSDIRSDFAPGGVFAEYDCPWGQEPNIPWPKMLGFPAYSVGAEPNSVVCNYRECGHKGINGKPCQMECGCISCPCPCCMMLAGRTIYGCKIG